MNVRPSLISLSAVLLLLIFSKELHAQTTNSGGLTGVVTDQSQAIVPDANVEIRDQSKGTAQSTRTDREGEYQFFFLLPGRYSLIVTKGGFQKESRAVSILLGPPVTANLTLEIAQASTTVTVTGEAPLVQAENGDFSSTMDQRQISELPNPGNDLTNIAQTAPGVVMSTDNLQGGANFSSLGMPGTSNLFTVNGMNDNDNGSNLNIVGSLGLLLGQNQIQEATIVSIGYSGQFGGAAGANMNYITKSGGNAFHGNAQYYWNGRVLNANDWFNNAFQQPRPFSIANQWAGSFGGPIKRDIVFFFLDTEGLRVLDPATYNVTIPSPQFETATLANIENKFGLNSASDRFYRQMFDLYNAAPGANSAIPGGFSSSDPTGCTGFLGPNGLGTSEPCAMQLNSARSLPSQDNLVSGRIDWNAGKNDRLFLQVQHEWGYWPFRSDPISSLFDAVGNNAWWQGQLIETHTFGSSAASQFMLAGTYISTILGATDPSKALAAFPATLGFWSTGTFVGLGGTNAWFASPTGKPTTEYQVSEDFVKTRGNQKFGFGANLQRIFWSNMQYTYGAPGLLLPQTLDAFYQGGVDLATPDPDSTQLYQTFNSKNSERISFYTLALYGQDEWHARSNVTLTIALRAEHQANPACKSQCFARLAGPFESISHDPNQPYNQAILIKQRHAFQSTDNILWEPRLSFAWQPLGVSRNTVIRGGVGIFYDPVPGNLATMLSSNPPLVNSYAILNGNLSPDETTSLFKDSAASNATFLDAFASGKTLAQIKVMLPTFVPPGINVPGRQTHSPQYQRWSLELQQAFSANTSLSIGYTGHHGIRELVANPSANAFGFDSFPAGNCTSPSIPPCADPRFGEVTEFDSNAVSNYNGMVVSFQHRFSWWGRGMFQANYTYGHAFDEDSNGGLFSFTSGSSLSPQDPNNLRDAYGPAEYDVRHSLNASYVWELPLKAILRGHGSGHLVQGWQVSGTIFARTGFPYTVFDFAKAGSLASNNYFGAIYAVPVGPSVSGSSCGKGAAFTTVSNPCQPPQLLPNGEPNSNAQFVQTGCESGFNSGNLGASGVCDGPAVAFAQGRNHFRAPSYFNTDLAVMKNTRLPRWEHVMLGIGVQFFNLFNHPNFGLPVNNIADPIFGQIQGLNQPATSILGAGRGGLTAMRMIQLKVQIQF
jgi:hypothetical protein